MRNIANSDLTAAQRRVLGMPLNQHMAVKGIAGSGKTILAIKRIKRILEDNSNAKVLFIVYNKTLQNFIDNVIRDEGIRGNVRIVTFAKWYKDNFGEMPGFDWDRIGENLTKDMGDLNSYHYIIVDECQDIGLSVYRAFGESGAVLSVFGDNSQRITKQATEVEDIHEELGFTERAQKLNENYRNGRLTVEVARQFCTTENASFLAGQVVRGDGQMPLAREFALREDELKFIRNICIDFGMHKSIGIISGRNDHIKQIYNALSDIQDLTIQRFYRDLYEEDRKAYFDLRIADRGVFIINYPACKGLEFDYVILPFLDETLHRETSEALNQFYVAITRTHADGRLFFTYCSSGGKPSVLDRIPSEAVEWVRCERKETLQVPPDDIPF
jgi:superfamily I DNA/RNA helicase